MLILNLFDKVDNDKVRGMGEISGRSLLSLVCDPRLESWISNDWLIKWRYTSEISRRISVNFYCQNGIFYMCKSTSAQVTVIFRLILDVDWEMMLLFSGFVKFKEQNAWKYQMSYFI